MKHILLVAAFILLLIFSVLIWNKIQYEYISVGSEYDYIFNPIPKSTKVEKNLTNNDYTYVKEPGKFCDECYKKEVELFGERLIISYSFPIKNQYYDHGELMNFNLLKGCYSADAEGLIYTEGINSYENQKFYFNKNENGEYILNKEISKGNSEEINWDLIKFIGKETELINPGYFK